MLAVWESLREQIRVLDGQLVTRAKSDPVAQKLMSIPAVGEEVGGILALLGLVSGGQIDSYNFETLNAVSQQVQVIAHTRRDARCAEARIVDGARCDDVQAALLHISLTELPETPESAHLQAIPTGLTVPKTDVDLLVQAGHDAVTDSAPLRAFLKNYPLPVAAGTPRPTWAERP
jgi:hypothetical protein